MSEKIYIYEDNFISLIKLIILLNKHKIKPQNIKNEKYSPNLFEEKIYYEIPKNDDTIKELLKAMHKILFSKMYYVYLSNHEQKELILYYFFLNFKKYGNQVIFHRNLKCVHELLKISKYVAHEAHKYTGFLRFRETTNHFLYAELEPESNILILISNHFRKRLANEYWIIKDNKRNLFSVFNKKTFQIYNGEELTLYDFKNTKEENEMEQLWKQFFNTVAIKERENRRCQMNFMPKKYWKYMIEMSDEL